MDFLVHPVHLVTKSSKIEGFNEIIHQIHFGSLTEIAVEVATEWTDDWPEGHGFGSSDGTYLLQDFIDRVIDSLGGGYKTVFQPGLKVISN